MKPETEKIFFELLRAGMWGQPADLSGAQPDTAQWAEILRTAREQTVMGTIFDGIMTLPAKCMPPREIKFQLVADVTVIEDRHAQMRGAVRAITEIYDTAGLDYMLLKGLAIGESYPVPQHRISGDIDFWLTPQDCVKTSALLFRGGQIHKDKRHISGNFRGIHIENHFEISHNSMKRYTEFCQEILSDEIRLPLTTVSVEGYAVKCPSPTFHALFMLEHIAFHLLTGLGLRQVCDWAVFLQRHADEIDRGVVAHILRKYHFTRAANAFATICVDHLGMPEACALLPLVRDQRARRDVQIAMNEIMEGGNFGRHYAPNHTSAKYFKLPALVRKPVMLYFMFRNYPKVRIISRKLFWGKLRQAFQHQIVRESAVITNVPLE